MVKDITLHVYEIQSANPKLIDINLPALLYTALDSSISIGDRAMQLNSLDPQQESDFVASYHKTKSTLFGCIVRMKAGDATHILKNQLKEKEIDLATLASQSASGVEGFIKDSTYFLMDKNHLILKSSHITKKAVQTYFNWLLKSEDGDEDTCDFKPKLSTTGQIQISKVRSVEIKETHFASSPQSRTISRNIDNVKGALLRELISEADDIDTLLEEGLVSASIFLHFHVRQNMKEEETEGALKALLNSTDSDDIKVSLKGGGTVVASTFEEKKTVSIDTVSDSLFNEQELEAEMGKYARELK